VNEPVAIPDEILARLRAASGGRLKDAEIRRLLAGVAGAPQPLDRDRWFALVADKADPALLASLRPASAAELELALQETLFGSGLEPDELELLRTHLTERQVKRGEAVFRRGDPGDAMYVLLAGQIGIWLPGDGENGEAKRDRRMVSYAPGVVFGEMGLMEGRARSADAIAESDAVLLTLSKSSYEQLSSESPALLGKLLLNIGLLLASRVRALTDELRSEQMAN